MNKSLILMFLLILGLTVVDQSWAMGKRGGPSTTKGSKNSSSNYSQNNSFGNHHNNTNDENSSDENSDQSSAPVGFYDDESSFSDDEFPAATTVPEPATLSLVGMGLASLLLKKRKY